MTIHQLTEDSLSVSSIQGTPELRASLSPSSLLLFGSSSTSSGNVRVTYGKKYITYAIKSDSYVYQ